MPFWVTPCPPVWARACGRRTYRDNTGVQVAGRGGGFYLEESKSEIEKLIAAGPPPSLIETTLPGPHARCPIRGAKRTQSHANAA
jgi:hypothetical protein